jgi:hypothetical protein
MIMTICFVDIVVPVVAKLPLGLLVPRFRKDVPSDFPFNPYYRDAIIASLSVVCRGEFNFVVASFGLSAGLLDADMYSAIVLAVLISSVFGPLLLSRAIRHYNSLAEEYLRSPHPMSRVNASSGDGYRPLFIVIQIRTPTSWGLHERFQHTLEDLGLMILDHRTWHTNEMEAVTMSELFVQDTVKHVKVKNCFFEDEKLDDNCQTQRTATISITETSDNSDHSPDPSPVVKSVDLNTIPNIAIETAGAVVNDDDNNNTTETGEETLRVIVGDGTSVRIGICEHEAIGLRLEQVRLDLVACLGDIDPETFAVKTTQWEPFLLDGPADEKGHMRQRTYTFQEEFPLHAVPLHDVMIPTATGDDNDCDESLGELSILDVASNTIPLSRSPSSATGAVDKRGEKQHVRFNQDDASIQSPCLPARPQATGIGQRVPRSVSHGTDYPSTSQPPRHHRQQSQSSFSRSIQTPRLLPRPQAISQQVPRSVSHGTNYSSTSQPPRHHRRHQSQSSFSGRILEADLWDTDEVAHMCFGPGRSHFQPAGVGHTMADEHFLALVRDYDYESDGEEEQNQAPTENDIETNAPQHRRRRSRHFSEDWRQEEETAAIQHYLHGYIRH